MAINNQAIMAISVKKSIMAVMASVLKDPKYEFFGCLVKEWSECRSPVKTVFKNMFRGKSYGENKKKLKKLANSFVKLAES